jgi:hypothetical protein
MPNVLALAFHVDYWGSSGLRDDFALPMARERQRRYVETLRLSSAFTPQVVDGRSSFVGSGRRRLPTLGEERTPGGRSESLNRQTIPHFRSTFQCSFVAHALGARLECREPPVMAVIHRIGLLEAEFNRICTLL